MKLGKIDVTTPMYKYICNLPCSIILGMRIFSKKDIDSCIELKNVNFSA